ncbi:MAG TPA: CHAT domain-containing protein, partial [Symbiobacteriaceae bacterium]|nr:CHAT domain-containing protein [Symbiobacteriaceae bacterium]
NDPEAAMASITLTALPEAAAMEECSLRVHYAYQGQVIGRAFRDIRVLPARQPVALPSHAAVPGVAAETPATATSAGRISTALVEAPVDITLVIDEARPGSEMFWCYVLTPFDHLNQARTPRQRRLGDGRSAADFADLLMRTVEQQQKTAGVAESLTGLGDLIAGLLGDEIWQTVAAVARHVRDGLNREPTLLVFSTEYHIPWELARFQLDPDRPPFLGAQVAMGRRFEPDSGDPDGPPMASAIDVTEMAVVWSDYTGDRQNDLLQAREEAHMLERMGAASVPATGDGVARVLGGGTPMDLLHFACHGRVRRTLGTAELSLEGGGLTLDSLRIRAARPVFEAERPFVFLNACQVGQAVDVLSANLGVAATFLEVGSRACVAPLWSIDDGEARDAVALFYQQTLAEGVPVGVALRKVRNRFRQGEQYRPTYLSYVYYGHPNLVLRKLERQ